MVAASFYTAVVAATVATVIFSTSVTAEDGSFSGTGTFENPAAATLEKCRTSAKESLAMIPCFESAVKAVPSNSSWWASLSLLYLRADMMTAAHESMNESTRVWLEALEPELKADGKSVKDGSMRWVELLRWAYGNRTDDDGEPIVFTGRALARRKESVEMGMLLAKKFEMENSPGDAHAIYYDFLTQITDQAESQLMDFHRRTGNVIAMALGSNQSSILYRIAESIHAAVDGLAEHIVSAPADKFPMRRMCGIEFNSNDEVKVRDVISSAVECVGKWGNLTQTLDDEVDNEGLKWRGIMRQHPLHHLAVLGATGVLETALKYFDGTEIPADRLGRSMLHHAAAFGWGSTVALMLREGDENLDHEDRGTVRVRHAGCASTGFLSEFVRIAKTRSASDVGCEGFTRTLMQDKDIDVTDDSGLDGGWNPNRPRPRYLHSDVDVRDASQIHQSDVMAAYVYTNAPVVLRNAFYDTTEGEPDARWKFETFKKKFGSVLVKEETVPRGQRFNVGTSQLTTIKDWIDKNIDTTTKVTKEILDKEQSMVRGDQTVATVHVDHNDHPLRKIAIDWAPATFRHRKRNDELFFFDTKRMPTHVTLAAPGSRTLHRIRGQGVYITVVFGHLDVTMLPPRSARSVKGELPRAAEAQAIRAELYTGDVLVVPDLWSLSWVARANTVTMERTHFQKDL